MRNTVALASLAAVFAAAPVAARAEEEKPPELTPEQKMARRHPQPVRVGDLIGRAIVDDATSTIGRVQAVVQASDGKIRLVTPYGGLLGFGSRLVAVPVEVVALLGHLVAAVDMDRAAFEKAPSWYGSDSERTLGRDEVIRIGLTRR